MTAMNMDSKTFEKNIHEDKKTALVEFWAPWCTYCRRIAPAFEKIAEQYASSLLIGQVNIDEEPGLAEQNQVEVIPTLIFYRDGQAAASLVAPDSKAKIEAFIQEHLK
jgi:thioredoxin 1